MLDWWYRESVCYMLKIKMILTLNNKILTLNNLEISFLEIL